MNMRDYPTLHLDTNWSKGTACSKKGYGCKWTWDTIQHYTQTQTKVKEQCPYSGPDYDFLGPLV